MQSKYVEGKRIKLYLGIVLYCYSVAKSIHLFWVSFQKLGNCLALLPKAKGDEDSWLLMMQKILLTINNQLNDVFQGLEPGNYYWI